MNESNSPRVKAVFDWGYRSGLMLTAAQVEDLLATIDKPLEDLLSSLDGSVAHLMGLIDTLPNAETASVKRDHDERGWQPK